MTPEQIASYAGPWTYELWVKTVFHDLVRPGAGTDADLFEPIVQKLYAVHTKVRAREINLWLELRCNAVCGPEVNQPSAWVPLKNELFQRLLARADAVKAWHKRDRELRRR